LETNSVLFLRIHHNIWDTVVATLPEGTERQVVTFYQTPDTVYSRTLVIQRDHYAFDRVNGTIRIGDDRTFLILLGNGELTQLQVNAAIDELRNVVLFCAQSRSVRT
jgi:hypothetical protein